jgi:fructose-1,6-bisphosphatase I
MQNQDIVALPVGITLDRFISRNQDAFPHASGELSQLLRDIALAAKIVNREVMRGDLSGIPGAADSENVQGESQQKLDVIADIRFVRALKNGGQVSGVVSEEKENIIQTGNLHAKYVVAIDPLDGSSNIDVNAPVGTIFSIYKRITVTGTAIFEKDFLQGGRKQVAAGYILYGTSMILMYTTGKGVNGFTYDHSLGDFLLSHKNIQSPHEGQIYSCNEGNISEAEQGIRNYVEECRNRKLTGRYIGALVGDIHRNLIKGGIYIYPATRKNTSGKLRMLYECYPIAFIVEQAGGLATNGVSNVLDIMPSGIHERTPFIAGSSKMVSEFLSMQSIKVSN